MLTNLNQITSVRRSQNSPAVSQSDKNNCLLNAVEGNKCNPAKLRKYLIQNIPETVNYYLNQSNDLNDKLAFLHYLDFNYDLGMCNQIGSVSSLETFSIVKDLVIESVQEKIRNGSMLDILVSGQILADKTEQIFEFNTNFQNDKGEKLAFLLAPKNESFDIKNKLPIRTIINYDHQSQHFEISNRSYFNNRKNYIDSNELIRRNNKIALSLVLE